MFSKEITILSCVAFLFCAPVLAFAQQIDWQEVSDKTVQALQQYVSINTSNPPGDVSQAAKFYEDQFKKAGVPVELYWTKKETGRVNVLGHLKGNGSKKAVMMLNHMDVVPVNRDAWEVDPFKGIKKDGCIWGRGSLDMKNYGVVQMMTMILLHQNNVKLDRDVFFLGVADEEITGTLGADWMAANEWDKIDAEFVLDEGGFGTQGFFTNDDRLIFSVGVAEKKVMWLKLSVSGTPGHGSMPPTDNANFIMTQALARVAQYETPIRITPVVAEMERRIGKLADTPYNNALRRNTISLTVTKGYTGDPPKSNVIPGVAEAVLDCRLLPDQDPDEFLAELKRVIAEPRMKYEFIQKPGESIVSPFDTDLFRAIEEQNKRFYPDSETVPHLIIYGTDSRIFRRLGAVCYGYFPGAVTMDEYRRIHGDNERIREESLRKAVRVYYNVIKSLCEAK